MARPHCCWSWSRDSPRQQGERSYATPAGATRDEITPREREDLGRTREEEQIEPSGGLRPRGWGCDRRWRSTAGLEAEMRVEMGGRQRGWQWADEGGKKRWKPLDARYRLSPLAYIHTSTVGEATAENRSPWCKSDAIRPDFYPPFKTRSQMKLISLRINYTRELAEQWERDVQVNSVGSGRERMHCIIILHHDLRPHEKQTVKRIATAWRIKVTVPIKNTFVIKYWPIWKF